MSPLNLKQLVSAAAIGLASFGAQASLTTYSPWEAAYTGNGLSGVLFDVGTGTGANSGVTTAMGAHAYKNGAYLANDGVSHFQADAGIYAADGLGRANWSFDFGWQYGTACTTCSAWLGIDTDFSDVVALTWVQVGNAAGPVTGVNNPESWNLLMSFLAPLGFNAGVASHTTFALEVRDGQSQTSNLLSASQITVDVPEPTSLALVGLGLFAALSLRKRAQAKV
jgi:hypothetical protein